MVNGVKVYLRKTTNTYTDDSSVNNIITQYITKSSGYIDPLTVNFPYSCPDQVIFNFRMNVYDIMSYSTTQKWTYLSSSQTINYDIDGNNPVTTSINYFYDNVKTVKLTREETINSKQQPVKNIKKYPGDEATITNLNTSEIDAITKLKAQNNFSPVLESEQYVNNILQSRVHLGYKDWGSGILKPESIKSSLLSNSIESRIQFQQYDINGNLLTNNKTNDVNSSYIWDYKGSLPVAEVLNASQTDIAYSSFEADGFGGWSFTGKTSADATSVTGSNSYNLAQASGSIIKTGLTTTNTYTVSYWSNSIAALSITGTISGYPILGRSVNGWYYHEHKITGVTSLTISGTGTLDELRLYPSTAQMTTYTYYPLIGIQSQCDASGKISYYSYDGLGRLKDIKDQDGKILKVYDYQYQQPK